MQTDKLTGLEFLRKMANDRYSRPTMATTIPMELVHLEEGACEFKATAGDMHLNPMGGVHGGFAATALDSATGCAVHTMLGQGESYGTVDLNIKMLRPVPKGKPLRAKGKVIHMSRSLGISEASLTDDEGKIYAHATSTCMILRREKPSELKASRRSDGPFSARSAAQR